MNKNLLNACLIGAIMKRLFLASAASETLDEFTNNLPDSATKFTVAFIPTAADPYEDKHFMEDDRKKLVESGFNVIDIDLKEKTKNQLSYELKDADIIFVAGGNTFYLLDKVQKSGFDKLVKTLVQKGVIYIGSSAGAILAGPSIEPFKTLDDPSKVQNLKSFKGLNLVNFVVLPHFGKEKYKAKHQNIMNKYSKKFKLLPITDLQAVVVDDNSIRIVEVMK